MSNPDNIYNFEIFGVPAHGFDGPPTPPV